jgi:DNA-binding transcriptional LysR family regulator
MPELSLRHYKAIVAVAELRSFTLAAHRLCVSVPALSKTVREAEELVGFALFDRSPKSVAPTAQGEIFGRSARDVVLAHQRSTDSAGAIRDNRLGALRIGGTQLANASFLLPAVRACMLRRPGVQISLVDNDAETLQDALLRGAFDLAVGPRRAAGTGIETIDICDVPLYFVAPQAEFGERSCIPWAEVIGKPLIFMDSRAVLHVMHYLDRRFVLDDWRVIGSATTALSVVENHGGYMVSAGYARKIARSYDVRCLKLVEPEVRMTLSLYFARSLPAQEMVRAVAHELAGCIAELLPD